MKYISRLGLNCCVQDLYATSKMAGLADGWMVKAARKRVLKDAGQTGH